MQGCGDNCTHAKSAMRRKGSAEKAVSCLYARCVCIISLVLSSWPGSEFWKERKSLWQRSTGKSSTSKYVLRNRRKPSSLMHWEKKMNGRSMFCLQRSSKVWNECFKAYLYIICLLLLKIKKDNTVNNCVKILCFTSVALSAVLSSNRDLQDPKSPKSFLNRLNSIIYKFTKTKCLQGVMWQWHKTKK